VSDTGRLQELEVIFLDSLIGDSRAKCPHATCEDFAEVKSDLAGNNSEGWLLNGAGDLGKDVVGI